jgi:hypothetical protein
MEFFRSARVRQRSPKGVRSAWAAAIAIHHHIRQNLPREAHGGHQQTGWHRDAPGPEPTSHPPYHVAACFIAQNSSETYLHDGGGRVSHPTKPRV